MYNDPTTEPVGRRAGSERKGYRAICRHGALNIKATLRRALPHPVYGLYARLRTQQIQRQYESLSCADAFERAYASGLWGRESADGTPNSGLGSTGRYASEYCALLAGPLQALRIASVADLGCGNFEVGRAIARVVVQYVGVDIVQSVIDYNERTNGNDYIRFVRADITCDGLPAADAALVRQVLQHLSNSEIRAALANILNTYPLVFITEHVYAGPKCVPNVDIPHGPATRVPMRSGVFVDRPPFNLQAKLLSDIYCAPSVVLRTWMVGDPPSATA
jgi:SAM-dependent methyltransferase